MGDIPQRSYVAAVLLFGHARKSAAQCSWPHPAAAAAAPQPLLVVLVVAL
jgi:hypothetical protein